MEKYKICPNPNCGKHNKSKAIECAWCETDLSSVKPTDDATEAARVQAENANRNVVEEERTDKSACSGKIIRICESCGTHNSANARKCTACGEDISDVKPTPEINDENTAQEERQTKYILTSLDGVLSFEIPEGKTLIGREEKLNEYLGDKMYVSRRHAEFVLLDGTLSIINISKTNYTYVNNIKINNQNPLVLHNGDEIGLGGNSTNGERQEQAAYFQVRAE